MNRHRQQEALVELVKAQPTVGGLQNIKISFTSAHRVGFIKLASLFSLTYENFNTDAESGT